MTVANDVKPVRLQRSRKKGSKLVSPNGLPVECVTWPGPWGNPFKAFNPATRPHAVSLLRKLMAGRMSDIERYFRETYPELSEWELVKQRMQLDMWRGQMLPRLHELRGKNLACWCASGQACHADVLLRIANS